MAILDFRNLVINSILVGLFIFGVLIISINLSVENQVDPVILQDELVNTTFANLTNTLPTLQDTATGQREGFESEIPEVGTDSFLFESVIGAGKTFSSSMTLIGNIGINFVFRSLGMDSGEGVSMKSVFVTILVILIIFLAWKIYKTGF